ncbi:MAG: DUF1127 domain-containing protein [Rubrimonas sp.]
MFATARRAVPRQISPIASLVDAWAVIAAWRAVSSQRRALSKLDARLLRDIGLDPVTAAAEAERPFWDLPKDC